MFIYVEESKQEMMKSYKDLDMMGDGGQEMTLQLLIDHVSGFDRALSRKLRAFETTRRWCGDLAHGGKGEILLAGEDS